MGLQGLAKMGSHPAYAHLEQEYPVSDRSLMRRLGRLLSALAHWAPVLGEVAFLPALAFPFVRLFKADLESCFEVCSACCHAAVLLPVQALLSFATSSQMRDPALTVIGHCSVHAASWLG